MTSNPLCASIWWSNEMWEGSEKGGKILAEIFWRNWEREMVFTLEFATVISNRSELTWQYRSYGLHEVKNFTIKPLSYVTQKLKTPIWCFRFSSLSLNPNWVWVMKTGLRNQAKHSKLCGSHVILKLSYEFPVIWLKTPLIQTGPKSLILFLLLFFNIINT